LLARDEVVALLLMARWRAHKISASGQASPPNVRRATDRLGSNNPSTSLRAWARFWRSQTTRRRPHPEEKPIWQRDFFDRQLRTGESYHQKRLYLWENPIKAGLVRQPEDWPYQGELNVLEWHESA
jgi:hypothetical protein